MAILRIVFLLTMCLVLVFNADAQDASAEIIGAQNIMLLETAVFIDFGSYEDIRTGWFVVSDNGERIAGKTLGNAILVWDAEGQLIDLFEISGADALPSTIFSARFASPDELLVVYSDGQGGGLAVRHPGDQTLDLLRLPFVPAHAWSDGASYWLEYVEERCSLSLSRTLEEPSREISCNVPSPESDTNVMVRIGRVLPPFAVTASADGRVQRWNLQEGIVEVTAPVPPDAGVPVFGQINASGSHLVWRDPDSTALYLLDFASGNVHQITRLDGQYIPFLLLTPEADVVIGVGAGGENTVAAWDVATGEQYMLGTFSGCSRPPDEVRLSADGTTLIIGCNGGLNIWQIAGAQT